MKRIKVNLLEWNVTYTDLVNWTKETNARVFAIGVQGNAYTYMIDEDDFTAFQLKFSKRNKNRDDAYFYCPYIPISIP